MLAQPDFEVKMLVDPSETLTSKGALKKKVRTAFGIDRSEQAIMQFMDSADRELDRAGWIVRIRAFDGDDDLQLTHKKRYDLDGDDVEGALDRARSDGFKDASEEYDSQVEWGRDRMTLTVSLKAKGGPRESGTLNLPGEAESRQIALSKLPSVLEQELPDRVHGLLEQSHQYGPVRGERWIGEWHGDEVFVEVWQIRRTSGEGFEPIVEISLKKKRREAASNRHEQLRDLLKDWLTAEQPSKTELILERYGP